jgi:hypothetical protein
MDDFLDSWTEDFLEAKTAEEDRRLEQLLADHDDAEFDKELDEFLDRLEDKPAANTNDGFDMRRRMRKPSIHKMIADAEKSGKTVTRFTTPDGATLTFGEPGAVDTAADDLDRELADFQERHRGRH